jgi:hypothetical protein
MDAKSAKKEGWHESQRYNLAVKIWVERALDGDAEVVGLGAWR